MSLLGPTYAICHCSPLPRSVCQFRVHSFFSLESWWPISKVRLCKTSGIALPHMRVIAREGFIFGKTLTQGEKLVGNRDREAIDFGQIASRVEVESLRISILQSLTNVLPPSFFPRFLNEEYKFHSPRNYTRVIVETIRGCKYSIEYSLLFRFPFE